MKRVSLFLVVIVGLVLSAGFAWSGGDHGSSCDDSATRITLDASGNAQISVIAETDSDEDYLVLNAPANGSLNVYYTPEGNSLIESWDYELDTDLLDSTCSSVSHSAYGRMGVVISAQVKAGDDYYLVFKGVAGISRRTPYIFEVRFTADDHGDSAQTASTITLDGSGAGSAEGASQSYEDWDYFKIHFPTEGYFTASVDYDEFSVEAYLPTLRLFDTNLDPIAEEYIELSSISVTPEDYFLAVHVDPFWQIDYSLSVQFENETSDLTVTIEPQAARDAGAQWRIDGGAWRNSGVTVNDLAVGSYTVQFSTIDGWNTPVDQTVTLTSSQPTQTSATYARQQSGFLVVTIAPDGAASAGAQWRVDDGDWNNSGATVSVAVGDHMIDFKDVTGWSKPGLLAVNVTAGNTTTESGTYVRQSVTNDTVPPGIVEVIPVDRAGIDYAIRVPSDTSFAVRISDDTGIDIEQDDSVTFNILDEPGANSQGYDRDISDIAVRVIKLSDVQSDDSVTGLWAVYDIARELTTNGSNRYPYDTVVSIAVTVTDKQGNTTSKTFTFSTETEDEHDQATNSSNLPETETLAGSATTTIAALSGNLEGTRLIFANGEPIKPRLGPELDEVPELDVAFGTGWPLSIQPPTVFNAPVTVVVPCTGHTDVSDLSIFYHDGRQWKLACDINGQVQAGGQGWIVPGSRKDNNYADDPVNNDPSSIEIQVYHSGTLQVGANIPQTGSLVVTISPQDAVDEGGKWRVDGGDWTDSGYTVSSLSLGDHTVEYRDVSGWTAPAPQTVTINEGQTTTAEGVYDEEQSTEGNPTNPTGDGGGGGGGCFIDLLTDTF